ncbi:MAG: fibronectin type III domain-containing protein [Ruminiclostridium sp.]
MNFIKKLGAGLLSAALLVSSVQISAFADSNVKVTIIKNQNFVIIGYEDYSFTAKVSGASNVEYSWQAMAPSNGKWFDLDVENDAWSGTHAKTVTFKASTRERAGWNEEGCENWAQVNLRCRVTVGDEDYFSGAVHLENMHTMEYAKELVAGDNVTVKQISPAAEKTDGYIMLNTEAGRNLDFEFSYTDLSSELKDLGFTAEPAILYTEDGKTEKKADVTVSKGTCKGSVPVISDTVLAWAGVCIMHGSTRVDMKGKYYVLNAEKGGLYGTAEIPESVVFGSATTVRLSDFPESLDKKGLLHYQWQYCDVGNKWVSYTNTLDFNKRTFPLLDSAFKAGRMIRCVITADGYDGQLVTNGAICSVGFNYATPPDFGAYYDPLVSMLMIPDSSPELEYVAMEYQTTAPDWSRAQAGNGGNLYLDDPAVNPITYNKLYYVYARYLPTDNLDYGIKYAESRVYTGVTEKIQAIEFDFDRASTKPGNVVKLTVNTVPADIPTFEGILGSKWYSNTNTLFGKEIVSFYADAACTKKLEAKKYYKSVYVKANEAHNDVQIAAETTVGYNDLKRATCLISISNKDGETYKISELSFTNSPFTLGNGVSGEVGMSIYPIDGVAGSYEKGYFGELKISVRDSKGNTVPDSLISVKTKGKGLEPTLVVKTGYNTNPGTYYCDVTVPAKHSNTGKEIKKTLTINVECASVAPTVTFSTRSLKVPTGGTAENAVNTDEADCTVAYSSSNPSVASVDKTGKVTAKGKGTATITATVTTSDGTKTVTKSTVTTLDEEAISFVKEDTAPKSTAKVSYKNLKANSVTISWVKKSGAKGYRIQQLVNGKWKTVKTLDSKTTSYTFTKLSSGTDYIFRVNYCVTSDGTKKYKLYGDNLAISTLPAKVKSFTASSVNNGTAKIKWSKSSKADGYVVEMYKNGKWEQVGKYDSKTTSAKLSSLKKGTTYKLRIRCYRVSVNGVAYSSYVNLSFKAK